MTTPSPELVERAALADFNARWVAQKDRNPPTWEFQPDHIREAFRERARVMLTAILPAAKAEGREEGLRAAAAHVILLADLSSSHREINELHNIATAILSLIPEAQPAHTEAEGG